MRFMTRLKRHSRDHSVTEARRFFLRGRRNGTGIDGVMQGAGLNASGFYSYFDCKDKPFVLAHDNAFEHPLPVPSRDRLRGLVALCARCTTPGHAVRDGPLSDGLVAHRKYPQRNATARRPSRATSA